MNAVRPKVSILLPVFNGALFLEPLLRSVVSQTLKDFEVLIFDDGSTDCSWDIISRFAESDRRVHAQRSPKNQGQERALERLFDKCGAPLIMFCDQDDVWAPDKTHELVSAIGDCSMAYGPSPLIGARGESLQRTLFDAVGPPIEGKDCLELLFRNTASAHALLMKRANFCKWAFAPSVANVLFDWRLAASASYTDGIKFVPTAVTWHRIHTANKNNSRALANAKKVRRSHKQQLDRVSDLANFVSMHPRVLQRKRSVFLELFNILEHYDRRPKWHVNDIALQTRAARIARDLSDGEFDLKNFNRKLARISRGWLHPAYWWGELRAARSRIDLRPK